MVPLPERPLPIDIALALAAQLYEVADILGPDDLEHFAWRLTQATNDIVYRANRAASVPCLCRGDAGDDGTNPLATAA